MKLNQCHLFCLGVLFFSSCAQFPSIVKTTPQTYQGVSQVVAYSPWLFSGAKPVGRAGFASLHSLRVRTIVCVDGTPPELDIPKEFGIKTYHIPIRYGKPTKKQIVDLATAVEAGRSRGNTFIHCHHGKHRSAAAAAVTLIGLGISTREEMEKRMIVSETSSQYTGLWEAVEEAVVIDDIDWNLNEENLRSAVIPEGMTEQMISIESAFDNLQRLQKSNWAVPLDHPDLVAVVEAGSIAESFRYLNQTEVASKYSTDFQSQLLTAWTAAADLERALSNNNTTPVEISTKFHVLSNTCTACHRNYRK